MYLAKIEEIIATRRFSIVGEAQEIMVTIGKPQPDEDSVGYYCPFQISGVGLEKIKYAKGLDAVQALYGAMFLIGADLQFLSESLSKTLRWEGDETGGLGFPEAIGK